MSWDYFPTLYGFAPVGRIRQLYVRRTYIHHAPRSISLNNRRKPNWHPPCSRLLTCELQLASLIVHEPPRCSGCAGAQA